MQASRRLNNSLFVAAQSLAELSLSWHARLRFYKIDRYLDSRVNVFPTTMHHLSQLFILLSSVAAALSADVQVVNVPLTDPSITLVGKACVLSRPELSIPLYNMLTIGSFDSHYNASFCGGFISLPSYGDSLLFPFSGKSHMSAKKVPKAERTVFIRKRCTT